jgi:hypothetical protein
MDDAKQFKPGSLSREASRAAGTGAGHPNGDAGGSAIVEDVKEMGTELIGAVRDGATSFLDEQRHRAAKEITALGEALRQSARCLDQTGSLGIGRYAEEAAGEIEQFAERLRARPLNMMADDVEDFARRWPAAFMAAAVGVGFLAGRFLVSSASRPSAPGMTPPAPRPATAMGGPVGGARHDFGAVGGAVRGGANAGYRGDGTRGTH